MVCFDETSKQLLGDVRPPSEAAPGRMGRYDIRVPAKLRMYPEPDGETGLFCEPKRWLEARRGVPTVPNAALPCRLRAPDEVAGGARPYPG